MDELVTYAPVGVLTVAVWALAKSYVADRRAKKADTKAQDALNAIARELGAVRRADRTSTAMQKILGEAAYLRRTLVDPRADKTMDSPMDVADKLRASVTTTLAPVLPDEFRALALRLVEIIDANSVRVLGGFRTRGNTLVEDVDHVIDGLGAIARAHHTPQDG